MVDLSQVKMPVVEYEDGRHDPLRQFTVDVSGYYVVNGRTYHRDGSPTYGAVILDNTGYAWASGGNPNWMPSSKTTKEELDAAYAAHAASKPVLVWDDSLMHLKTAKHGDGLYTLRYQDGMASWDMEFHSPSTHVGFGRCGYLDRAKEHCERHARGE
jgi:hypothetical protein